MLNIIIYIEVYIMEYKFSGKVTSDEFVQMKIKKIIEVWYYKFP